MHQPMPEIRKADLSKTLRAALADTFAFYFIAHAAHWNITGISFPSLHRLFGKIYEDAHGAVDAIAEHIRTLDEMAPFSLDELLEGGTVHAGLDSGADAAAMLAELITTNDDVTASLNEATAAAVKAGKAGLANFLQDRIDVHAKWGWMLKATAT